MKVEYAGLQGVRSKEPRLAPGISPTETGYRGGFMAEPPIIPPISIFW